MSEAKSNAYKKESMLCVYFFLVHIFLFKEKILYFSQKATDNPSILVKKE